MLHSFFPPKYIREVGTFQDAGPLENDPLLLALSEVDVMFPLVGEPDFVISLGTGEPGPRNYDLSTDDSRSIRKNGMFTRSRDLILEKMRDKPVRRAYKTTRRLFQILHRVHRLSIDFEGAEPRLDDTRSMPVLKEKVQRDHSLSKKIDDITRCVVASLFYFELDSIPERFDGKHVGTGHILCSLRGNNPALKLLLNQLSDRSAGFYLNNNPILGTLHDSSNLGENGDFRKRVELNVADRFTVSLKQGDSEPCDISASPFSVDKLIEAQGLNADFGRASHRRKKRAADWGLPAAKRQRH
ncbi:hypothetical protein K469DRAFT_711798 [Zopfia rhizophila CBS 207.26]|uniref:FabD/lysophospholipase-like protein n=1 Tax=Zopfia rhizophila CBS 207.26 TaxID=1314779 RepID=A0A6A6DSL6_9PEZI|nr:hypothetical protein K469DRAFT_711798 [Zopfia rhizophila CBS 207.26]